MLIQIMSHLAHLISNYFIQRCTIPLKWIVRFLNKYTVLWAHCAYRCGHTHACVSSVSQFFIQSVYRATLPFTLTDKNLSFSLCWTKKVFVNAIIDIFGLLWVIINFLVPTKYRNSNFGYVLPMKILKKTVKGRIL